MIVWLLFAQALSNSIERLLVKENLVCKQLILTGEAKCEILQADRVVTEELDIQSEYSSDTL